MRIEANNAHEASKQILRVIYANDYNHSDYKPMRYGYTYVYYSVHAARFSFKSQQRKTSSDLIKRYQIIDGEDIIKIVACKYSFSQIAIGAILSRKIMSHREFFEIVRDHFEWVG